MRRILVLCSLGLGFLIAFPTISQADRVKQATSWYLKGSSFLKSKQYGKAVKAFTRAHGLLPGHPHFNCHRASFLNYRASAYSRMRKPYAAMRSYYKAAYRSGCRKKPKITSHAASLYRRMYRRWMCSISFETTPPKARIFSIVGNRDTQIGHSPYKKDFSPGTYRFKIRLYDHKTQYYNVKLRPGMHVKKIFKMIKGDDPVNRPETVDVAPPVAVSGGNPNAQANPNALPSPNSKKEKRISLGINPDGTGRGVGANADGVGDLDPNKRRAKPGPPIYKQAWFWAVIGGVAVGATVVAIVIPKEQQLTVNQTTLFNP